MIQYAILLKKHFFLFCRGGVFPAEHVKEGMDDIESDLIVRFAPVFSGVGDGGKRTDERFAQEAVFGIFNIAGECDTVGQCGVVKEFFMEGADFSFSNKVEIETKAIHFQKLESLFNDCLDFRACKP